MSAATSPATPTAPDVDASTVDASAVDIPVLDISTLDLLAIGGGLGAGLVAGIFLAFSGFVMRALADMPPAAGILAMQRINVRVLNAPIMALLFGTGMVSLGLGVAGGLALADGGVADGGVADGGVARGLALLIGAGAYLLGCLAVTGLRNVPLNERLAPLDPAGAEAARLWARYLERWTAWNHRRTVASALAGLCFMLAPLL
ncbi:DUF1772 domain-containing protein [Marivibrio halodurans]|uniref:DUF1772 domain-containing protein n=1 Tax=Marivibrio halodurans TaxID=2039722 RepID=A0A8J7V371_9PROT|nr:anthrone oxygenase family protein [Marivibrio halodurans]MBP5857921.1 DUF1772 domain-containing protein [Marivibrio halodurans]